MGDGMEQDKARGKWASVSLPRAILLRIDAQTERRGYASRADYVRAAVLKQLDAHESSEVPPEE